MKTIAIKKLIWLAFYSVPLVAFLAHSNEPRPGIAFPGASAHATSHAAADKIPYPASAAKTSVYRRRTEESGNPFRVSATPAKYETRKAAARWVSAYVQTKAVERGVNPKLALWIVRHESQFNPHAKGDGEASRGLWQISKIYHPEVSDAVAYNVASSTEWSLERIRAGKVNEWSTYRFCRTLYEDCPF